MFVSPEINRGFEVIVNSVVPEINLKGFVKDESNVISFKINREPVALNQNGGFDTSIVAKNNKLFIEAVDEFGNITTKKLHIAQNQIEYDSPQELNLVKPALWGLSVGVSKYGSTTLDLKYADNDARSLSSFFRGQQGKLFSEVHFKTLTNSEVTRDSIIENISTHLGQAAPNDMVLIFLAGHGIRHKQSGSYYFLPYDADSNSVLSKGLRISDFEEAVNILKLNVKKVLVAMDTCHSGAMEIGMRSVGGGENIAGSINDASGIFILSASKSGEESFEHTDFKLSPDDSGHGVFTYSMIDGLKGAANYDGDGVITLNELSQFLAKKIPRLTKGKQHPYFRIVGTELPLVLLN